MDITLTAPDGHQLSAYENTMANSKVGMVVIQEIFGVNEHIRTVVDRFQAQGFHSLAPALFDRIEKNVQLGYQGEDVEKGRSLRGQLDWDGPLNDIKASVQYLRDQGCEKVFVIGFCYGGSLAWLSATRIDGIDGAIGCYGGQVVDFCEETPKCPTMLFFGGLDKMIPQSDIDKIQNHQQSLPIHVFPDADHGFNCDLRASFHEESAMAMRKMALDFFNGI